MTSERPPIHPNLNMDFQEKFEAQEANPYFADGRAMRVPVAGTIARGFLRADSRLYTGRTENGDYITDMPVPLSRELLLRGQERYDIFCSVCHGKSGNGLGIIMTGQYGYTPAPSYHDERLREVSDGYLYDVITNGVRSMPGYAQQIPVADRWAITAYIRALQRSQNASEEDLPADVLRQLEQAQSANMSGGSTGAAAGAAPPVANPAGGATTEAPGSPDAGVPENN